MSRWHVQVLADQTSNLLPTPPKFLPSIYRNEYLLDGHVDLKSLPVSDVYNGNPKPLEWSQVQPALCIMLQPTFRSTRHCQAHTSTCTCAAW